MGWFSKNKSADAAPAETLPTTTTPPKPVVATATAAATPAASAAETAEVEKKGGVFCGMSLTEALIALVFFALFFFFVVWPLVTAYLMLAVLWIIMWPLVKFIPPFGRHKYVGPMFTVLSVVVTSPIKVSTYLYKTFKHGKKPEDTDKTAEVDPMAPVMAAATSAAATAAAQQVMQQKV